MIYIRERGYPQRAAAAHLPGSWPTHGQHELEGDLWLPSSIAATRVIHVGSAAVKTLNADGRSRRSGDHLGPQYAANPASL